jgi:ornithine carbamoyltransferase
MRTKRDFLSIADWSGDELRSLLDISRRVKEYPANFAQTLAGRSVAMIFEKQSLRTHVTFDVGIYQLGAHPVYLTQADISLGKRESVRDTAKNLERWVDAAVVRTFAHSTCVELAVEMRIPVVNALTDFEHPCQAVADLLTAEEHLGSLEGKRMVFMGDGNNVCHSLMLMAAKLGMNFTACTPRGYEPDMRVFKASAAAAEETGAKVDLIHIPKDAVRHADVIYTDVWTSMGQEAEKEARLAAFKEFQVNEKLMSHAKSSTRFMHCLPAHRGEEVTDGVIDSAHSVVFDQAENRLHTEKAVLLTLLHGD